MAKARARRAPSKASYHHGDLRRALVDTALAIVSEEGTLDVSLREVARRAGVTYAAPYHHFADKSALLAAVGAQGFEFLNTELENARARAGERGIEAQLATMAEAYMAFALAHSAHYRVMFLPELKTVSDAAFHAVAKHAFDLLLDRVIAARPGESEPARRTIAAAIWAALHGLSLLAMDGMLDEMFPKPAKLMRDACKLIVRMAL